MVQETPHPGRKRGSGGAYSLEPAPAAPALPGLVVMRADADDALDALLEDLVAHALACVREFGDFHLAASGEKAFEPLFVRLMIDPRFRALPWKRTHLWIMHEEMSPAGASAFRRIEEAIVEHSDIPPDQAHAIDLSAADPAAHYERRIRAALEWREPGHDRLDAAVMTPAQQALAADPDTKKLVHATTHAEGGRRFVALTPTFLRSARLISVLATGAGSRIPIRELSGPSPIHPWRLHPIAGELRWYVDAQAATE